jgi:hypothetical protein
MAVIKVSNSLSSLCLFKVVGKLIPGTELVQAVVISSQFAASPVVGGSGLYIIAIDKIEKTEKLEKA